MGSHKGIYSYCTDVGTSQAHIQRSYFYMNTPKVIHVHDWSMLERAIEEAEQGDTIFLHPGEYRGKGWFGRICDRLRPWRRAPGGVTFIGAGVQPMIDEDDSQ